MKIDILFFNKKFENKDKFIVDSEIFSEYITTHGFEGKPKDLLLMPPSLSSRGNETILASSEDIESTDLLELGYLIGKKIKSSVTIEIINFEGNMELLIQGIMFSEYSFDSYKTKETKESIEINFSEKGGIGTACLISSEKPAGNAGNMTGNHFTIRRM